MSDAQNVRPGGMSRRVSEIYDLLIQMNVLPTRSKTDFIDKLIAENNWSKPQATQIYQEYLRFLLLAWVSPSMVVPSPMVDQVWHLHLTHSRHYWDILCGQILQRPLHHDPSSGEKSEKDRHASAYHHTLELYSFTFGENPPSEIWPSGCTCTPTRKSNPAILASSPIVPVFLIGFFLSAVIGMTGYSTAAIIGSVLTVILGLIGHLAHQSSINLESRNKTQAPNGVNRRQGQSTSRSSDAPIFSGATGSEASSSFTAHTASKTSHASDQSHHAHGSDHVSTPSGHSDGHAAHSCGTSCGSSCGGGCGGGD